MNKLFVLFVPAAIFFWCTALTPDLNGRFQTPLVHFAVAVTLTSLYYCVSTLTLKKWSDSGEKMEIYKLYRWMILPLSTIALPISSKFMAFSLPKEDFALSFAMFVAVAAAAILAAVYKPVSSAIFESQSKIESRNGVASNLRSEMIFPLSDIIKLHLVYAVIVFFI